MYSMHIHSSLSLYIYVCTYVCISYIYIKGRKDQFIHRLRLPARYKSLPLMMAMPAMTHCSLVRKKTAHDQLFVLWPRHITMTLFVVQLPSLSGSESHATLSTVTVVDEWLRNHDFFRLEIVGRSHFVLT